MIQKIKIQNIRSFSDASFDFKEGVNLIVGPNGSGKTTILEAAALFSFGKILSAPVDFAAVFQGQKVGRVEIFISDEGKEREAEAVILPGQKIFKVLQNKVPASQIIGFVKIVYFNPETINLVCGAPHIRRRELDLTIAQKKRSFVKTLLLYRNVLKQRNNLLKRIDQDEAERGEIDFWDGELARYAREIIKERSEFLGIIESGLGKMFADLSGREGNLKIKMLFSCDYDRFDEVLAGNFEADLHSGLTNFGPHRDDFSFELRASSLQSTNLRSYASRGEQRLAAVAFKMETKKYLTDGEEPVVILDDIFSELDEKRRDAVASVLDRGPLDLARGKQIFISATDERVVPVGLKKKAKIIRLE